MRFAKKIFFALAMSVVFFWNVAPAIAADLQVEFNPLCWEKKECQDTRVQFVGEGNAKSNEGWLENTAPCNKLGWGMCLPVNATKAQISFGGNADFSDAGVYIKTVYNYSLIIIGILAVVMIIISGAQWITSAGNSEAIGAAKKRITGAIIGLFIAYMSYNILMSINPATINLRLPQIYMIRQQVLASKWCRDMKDDQMFAWGADQTKQSDKLQATGKEAFTESYPYIDLKSTKFWCGQRFFIYGAASDAFCYGDRCSPGTMCSDIDPIDENNPNHCIQASVAGEISHLTDSWFEGLEDTWEDIDEVELYIVCATDDAKGRVLLMKSKSTVGEVVNGKQSYVVSVEQENLDGAVEFCGGDAKVRGGFLMMNFTPNFSTNIVGEDKIIGRGGKEIAGGYFLVAALQYPGLWKDEAFISLPSIRSGATINVDAQNMKMWFKMADSFDDAWEGMFGDETVASQVVSKLKASYAYYGPYLKEAYAKKLAE